MKPLSIQEIKQAVLQTIRDCKVEPGVPETEDVRFGCYWFYFHALRHKERYRTRAADALTDLIKEQVA